MPKKVINNWLGGIAPSKRQGKESQYYIGSMADPITQPGYLRSGFELSNLDSSDSNLGSYINASTSDSSRVYLIEGDGSDIHSMSWSFGSVDGISGFSHTIGDDLVGHSGHASFTGEDVIAYTEGGTDYLYYSWNDDNDGDVGRVDVVEGSSPYTFNDDYLSNSGGASVLNKNFVHPMMSWEGNGMLYIANGPALVEFDGSTSTADDTAFELATNWEIVDMFPVGDLIAICANYEGSSLTSAKSGVFFWDGSSNNFVKKNTIRNNKIKAGINIDENYYILTEGLRVFPPKDAIRKWDGNAFKVVQRIVDNDGTYYEAPTNFGSITNWKSMILFTVGERVMAYGPPTVGATPGLFVLGKDEEQSGTNNSILYDIGQTIGGIYFSSHNTTSGSSEKDFLSKLDPSSSSVNFKYSSQIYDFESKARINYIKFYFEPLTSGCDDDITIYYNDGNDSLSNSIKYSELGAVTNKRINMNKLADNFRIKIETDSANSTSGVVYTKIVIDYDYVESDL